MFRSSKKDVKVGAKTPFYRYTQIKTPLYRRHDEAKKMKKETCVICFKEDVDPNFMCFVDKCGHQFCLNCVIKHIEVKLLDGQIPTCPHYRCNSQLSIDVCGQFLTPKLSSMWRQMIRERLIPVNERFYCPHPGCSYLMSSKTELSTFSALGFRTCYKCHGSFCIHCKAPWHGGLSCTDYKKSRYDDDEKLESLAKLKGWRQCPKCQHMVERISGCSTITCRCGNSFCYKCGNNMKNCHRDCTYGYTLVLIILAILAVPLLSTLIVLVT